MRVDQASLRKTSVVKRNAQEGSQVDCIATACDQQWLYRFGEGGVVYSQRQNRFAGLDAAGTLAYQAFDAGATPHDLSVPSGAGQTSLITGEALDTVFALSRGRFPESSEREDRRDWPAPAVPKSANVEVHGISIFVECPPQTLGALCRDCFLSCPSTTRPARFHLRLQRAENSWAIFANDQEIFASLRDEQIGLGMLHAMRSLLYAEAPYDIAFHAAMVADDRHGIMLCAPRESGKSTLAAHLAAHGVTLISDEPALLHVDTTSISSVEMPISLKEGTWNILAGEWPQLSDAPIHIRSDGRRIKLLHPKRDPAINPPRRLTHILFPEYAPSSPAFMEALSPLRALMLLNEGGMLLGKQMNKDVFEQFLGLICSIPTHLVHYSSLQEADHIMHNIIGANGMA
jgi:hypothetical protein